MKPTKIDLFVEKNLISVYKVQNRLVASDSNFKYIAYTKAVFTYDITLINNTCYTLRNIGIQDTFFGLMNSIQVLIGLRITSCCDNLVVRPVDDIYQDTCPQLLDTCNSYLPPFSACTIIVGVVISPSINNAKPEINELRNTITVTGDIEYKSSCEGMKLWPIKPILEDSIIWEDKLPLIPLLAEPPIDELTKKKINKKKL
jgi:hypothetical protein